MRKMSITFHPDGVEMPFPRGPSYFFENKEPVKCPIKSCVLKSKGCLTDSNSKGVGISPDNYITYKEDIFDGYDDTVCLSCTNGQQEITHDGLEFE